MIQLTPYIGKSQPKIGKNFHYFHLPVNLPGMAWPDRLKKVLDERMVNRSKLTQKLGLGKNAIYQMLNGHEPSVTVGVRLARSLGLTAEELFGDRGVASPAQSSRPRKPSLRAFALSRGAWHSRKSIKLLGPSSLIEAEDFRGQTGMVPVLAPIAAGEPREAHDGGFPTGHADAFVAFECDDPTAFALRVDGDSMLSDFLHGDIIVVSPQKRILPKDSIPSKMLGVVVFGSDPTAAFKRLREEGTGVIALEPLNSAFPPMRLRRGEVSAIYPVVGLIRKE